MKPFHEIEEALSLSAFERHWYNKQTKISKLYWTLLFNRYRYHLSIDLWRTVTAYKFLFYKPEEAHYWITSHYDGIPTNEIKQLKPDELMRSYESRSAKFAKELEDELFEQFANYMVGTEGTYNEIKMPLHSFDERHPDLEKVSECLYLLIKDTSVPMLSDGIAIVGDFNLKPSQLQDLNLLLSPIIKIDLLWQAARYLQDFTSRGGYFFSKIEVNGATSALEDALSSNPDLMQNPDKRISYLLNLKYCEVGGAPLGSIQKAINRIRT